MKLQVRIAKKAKTAPTAKKPVELRPEDLQSVAGGRRLYPGETRC